MRMKRRRMEFVLSTLLAQVLSWRPFLSRCFNNVFVHHDVMYHNTDELKESVLIIRLSMMSIQVSI